MTGCEQGIRRRDFLKGGFAGLSWITLNTLFNLTASQFSLTDTLKPVSKERWPNFPQELKGMGICAPYLHTYPDEVQKGVLLHYLINDVKTIRIFASLDPKVIDENIEEIKRLNRNIQFINDVFGRILWLWVSLDDHYGFKSDEPKVFYPSTPMHHWSLSLFDTPEEAKAGFLLDKEAMRVTKSLYAHMTAGLQQGDCIKVWEMANEPRTKVFKSADKNRVILTAWLLEMLNAIRQEDNTRPVITGTRYPWEVSEQYFAGKDVYASFHGYPQFIPEWQDLLKDYAATIQLPLVVGEVGSSRYLPIRNGLLKRFTLNLFNLLNTQELKAPVFSLWHGDPLHRDSFELNLLDDEIIDLTNKVNESLNVSSKSRIV